MIAGCSWGYLTRHTKLQPLVFIVWFPHSWWRKQTVTKHPDKSNNSRSKTQVAATQKRRKGKWMILLSNMLVNCRKIKRFPRSKVGVAWFYWPLSVVGPSRALATQAFRSSKASSYFDVSKSSAYRRRTWPRSGDELGETLKATCLVLLK